jgi:hypothetical protein
MNGVRCGGCGGQKLLCGALWWLSYINCFFGGRGAALLGRVGMLSLFTASPAQFTPLKHCANVICEKIRRNRIFAENRFFFVKKKVHQKKLCAFRFDSEKNGKNSITSRILTVFFRNRKGAGTA